MNPKLKSALEGLIKVKHSSYCADHGGYNCTCGASEYNSGVYNAINLLEREGVCLRPSEESLLDIFARIDTDVYLKKEYTKEYGTKVLYARVILELFKGGGE